MIPSLLDPNCSAWNKQIFSCNIFLWSMLYFTSLKLFSLSIKFMDLSLTLHKNFGTHIQRLNSASQKVRHSAKELDTRHTLLANNKSPPDIKVPLPHSPQNKSSIGSKPDWTDVSASTSWGGVRLFQLWSTKRRNSQCQELSAENAPRTYSQRERHQRWKCGEEHPNWKSSPKDSCAQRGCVSFSHFMSYKVVQIRINSPFMTRVSLWGRESDLEFGTPISHSYQKIGHTGKNINLKEFKC